MATTTAKKKPVKKTAKLATKEATSKSTNLATKTTSKTVKSTNKSTGAKASNMTKRPEVTPFEKLRGLHFSNAFSGVVLAVLTIIFVSPQTRELLLNYQARDTFIDSDAVTLGPATESLLSFDIRYLLVGILGLTAIVSLLFATKLYKRYESTVKAGISGLRWLLFGLVSLILVEFVSIIAGVQEVNTLKSVGGFVLAGAVFGWLSERENKDSKSPKKVAYIAAILSYFMAVLPMLVSIVATSIIAGERFSWYVYALVATVVLGFIASLMTLRSSINNKNKFEYVTFEQRYIRIDQIVKFATVLIIFSAFNK